MTNSARFVFLSSLFLLAASHASALTIDDCGGETCDTGQFCYLPEGVCSPASYPDQGTCADMPVICDPHYSPVCGCDHVTYHNDCFALQAGRNLLYRGECRETCGGFAGSLECSSNLDFCYLDRDGCCCDLPGLCQPPPVSCPTVCQPVCGCDDGLYRNRCEAEMAPANVKQEGACAEVLSLEFVSPSELTWTHYSVTGSPYNLYRQTLDERPPAHYGDCIESGIVEDTTTMAESPPSGELWLIQVTSAARDGTDSMGYQTALCEARAPAAWCSQ